MYTPVAPPVPSAAPFTTAAALRWRAARTAWRLDSRWLALAPLAFVILGAAAEPTSPGVCNAQGICRDPWGESAAIWTLLAEAVLLAGKPRIRALIPPTALALFWYLPHGLVTPLARWSAVLLHVLLTAVLVGAEVGRRRARQQLDELMAPPVPFPWTAAGAPSPAVPEGPPAGRRLVGGLLLAVAVTLPLYGLWAQYRQEAADRRAVRITGTAGEFDQDDVLTVHYQPPGADAPRTARLDVWWADRPQPGGPVALLLDGGDVRAAGDDYDLTGQLIFGGLIALPGLLLLGSSLAHDARRARPAFVGAAPALAVRVRADARGHLLVLPVDGPPGGPALWRLVERDRYYWAQSGELSGFPEDEDPDEDPDFTGPAWIPEHPVAEGADEDYPERGAKPAPGRSVPAVLYRGPDGTDRQLLLRPALLEHDPSWVAAEVDAVARAPRLLRAARLRREREQAVVALSAGTVAAAPPAGTGAPRLPAVCWELPLPLRAAAGPAAAVLAGALAVLHGGSGWVDGLLRPLWIGSMVVLAVARAASWQLAVDRDGLRVSGALRVRRIEWRQIGAAAVHRGSLTVRLRSGEEVTISARVRLWLAGHFSDRYDPAEPARTLAVGAHRSDLRPREALPGRLGHPQHLLNRLSLIGYALFAVARYLL
ncbi:hypothetical protein ACPC54_41560 [Kitasatospora sp. NPDC094028]